MGECLARVYLDHISGLAVPVDSSGTPTPPLVLWTTFSCHGWNVLTMHPSVMMHFSLSDWVCCSIVFHPHHSGCGGHNPDAPSTMSALRPHRCNDRVEDAVQALFEGDFRHVFLPRARIAWECFRSAPGQEPDVPYVFVQPSPSQDEREHASKPVEERKREVP